MDLLRQAGFQNIDISVVDRAPKRPISRPSWRSPKSPLLNKNLI